MNSISSLILLALATALVIDLLVRALYRSNVFNDRPTLQMALLFGLCLLCQWPLFVGYERLMTRAPVNTPVPAIQPHVPLIEPPSETERLVISTDTLKLAIDLRTGDIIVTDLLHYPHQREEARPLPLLSTTSEGGARLRCGVISTPGGYEADTLEAQLEGETLEVPLIQKANGVLIKKIFKFTRGEYLVKVRYEIKNDSDRALEVGGWAQLVQTPSLTSPALSAVAYSTDRSKYKKRSASKLSKRDLQLHTTTGWIAKTQPYFVAACIPKASSQVTLYTELNARSEGLIGFAQKKEVIPVGGEAVVEMDFFLGPTLAEKLRTAAPHLELSIEYGIFWFLAEPLLWALKFFTRYLHNWGLSIILLTLILKGVLFYPFNRSQYKQQATLRRLKPKLKALEVRYGDNVEQKNQALMALYQQEAFNPFSTIPAQLLQIPFFWAFYRMLQSAIELRHAPFYFWIQDLSAPDPYYILPFLAGAVQFLNTRLTHSSDASSDNDMAQYMPLLFAVICFFFPSGIILYQLVSSLITLVHQYTALKFAA